MRRACTERALGKHSPSRGGDPGADNASDDEDDGPEVALFAVHSDSDNSSVSDDDDIVSSQCTRYCPLILVFLLGVAKFRHI